MISGIEIEVKKKSGEFDLESIYTLDLSHQGNLSHSSGYIQH